MSAAITFFAPCRRFFGQLWKKFRPSTPTEGLTGEVHSRAKALPGVNPLTASQTHSSEAAESPKPAETVVVSFAHPARSAAALPHTAERSFAAVTQPRTTSLAQNPLEQKANLPLQINEVIEEYLLALKRNHCSRSTIRNYKSDIKQFCTFANENDLEAVFTKPKLLEFAEEQAKKGLQLSTIKRKLVSIAQFVIWARRGKLITDHRLIDSLHRAETEELLAFTSPKPATSPTAPPITTQAVPANQPISIQVQTPASTEPDVPEEKQPPTPATPAVVIPAAASPTQEYATSAASSAFPAAYSLPRRQPSKLAQLPAELVARWLPYFNLAVLTLFVVGLGYFTYRQFQHADPSLAYPATLTRPNRMLSFQGRLTDTADSPIVAATTMRFRLYDDPSAGTQLWDSNTCSIDPDQDGIFNANLGAGAGAGSDDEECGAEIASSVFSENSNVWLQVTVGAETLTPRQPIRTVAYALNAETLQGFPITSGGAVASSVVSMDSTGKVVLAQSSPTLQATTGTFTISAPAITIATATSSNGDINLTPDGTGKVNVSSDLAVNGATSADITSTTTTASLFNSGVTTLNIGGAATAVELGAATGTTSINNALTVDGNTTLGNATTDSITFTGRANSSLLPITDNTYDLGSASLRWANIYGTDMYATTLHQNGNLVCDASGANCPAGTTNYWSRTAGNLYPVNTNDTISATTSAAVAVTITQTGAFNALLVEDQASDSTPFVIDQSGNVGIGKTTPAEKLDVVGNVQFSGALMPNGTAGSAGQFLISGGAGAPPTWTNTVPATSVAFSGITSGTNTTAAMVVGAGATLDYTSTGTINASTLIGATWAAPGAIGSGTPNSGAFTTLTSSGNSTIGTGASTTNTFGAGASSVNTIGSSTTPGALTLHGATTLDNTFTVSGSNLTTLGGNLTVSGTTWTATPTISGLITATSGLTANGALTANSTLTANNTFTLGDGGDAGSVNTSDWDITTTGDLTGIGAITMDGNFSQTGSTTFSTGTGTVSLNGNILATATSGTAISINNTGITTDLSLQNGETIDNNSDGVINIGATTLELTGGSTVHSNQTSVDLFNTTTTTLNIGGAATTALNLGNGSGNYSAINLGSGAGTHTINIAGTGATAADIINIGTGGTAADTITIGSTAASTALALNDDNWNITGAGAANFVSIGGTTPGTAAFTTLSAAPTGTNDISFTTDADSTFNITGLQAGSGNSLCVDVSNNIVTCTVGSGGISGSGTAGQIAFFTATGSISSETSGFGWDDTNDRFTISSTNTTGTAAAFTDTALTTGRLTSFTSTNNSAANTAWSANLFAPTNAQGTTAVSTGSIAGLDLQFTQATSVAGNTETAARINLTQNDSSSTDATVASLLDLANNDTSTGNQITVTDGLKITGSNITNGINLSGTFGTNLITSSNFSVTQAGAITGVGVNSGSGLLQGTGGLTVTGTANLNATGTAATNIGNSTGALTIASGGTSSWNNTAGNLTIQTLSSGTMSIDSVGALQLGTTNSTSTSLGKTGSTLTINPTTWIATPTISGLITATSGVTANGALTANSSLTANGTFTLGDGGDAGSISTSDWAISSAGALTGITGITNDAAYTQTGTSSNTFTGPTTFSYANAANSGTTNNTLKVAFSTPADSTGTNTHQFLFVDPVIGNATGGTNTTNLIATDAVTGDADVTLNAVNIGALTGTAATETALNIGSGWDSVLTVGGVSIINGSGQFTGTLSGTLFTAAGDSGTSTIVQGDTFTVAGGTNGIDTLQSGDTVTLNLDTTEIGTTTFGSGSGITWTFDGSGGTDTTIAFGNNTQTFTTGTATFTGDVAVNGGNLTTSASTATLFNTNAATLSLGGASTTALNLGNGSGNYSAINLGSGAGTHTINIAGSGATAADIINIGTGGTTADTITIGNNASSTALALTSGTGDVTLSSTDQIILNSSKVSGGTTTEALSLKSTADLGSADEVLQIGDSAADMLTILGNGNVGIGTAIPVVKLDVVGSERVKGTSDSTLSGTADPDGTVVLPGSSTFFTTELVPGDQITVNGETRTVLSIASNTSLTVDTAFSNTAPASITRTPAILTAFSSSDVLSFYVNGSKYAYAKRYYDIDNNPYYIEPGASGTAVNIAGDIQMVSGKSVLGSNLTFGSGGTTTLGGTTVTTAANFSQTGSSTFSTGTGAVSLNGDVTIAAGKSLTFTSGTGTLTQNYSNTTGTQATFNHTNSASSGTNTSNVLSLAITGTNNASGTNTITGIDIPNVTAKTNNTYYGIVAGTGLNDILRYNGTQIISGTGILQSAGLSGTYSNTLTLSNASNSITAGTLTATGGTINNTTIGQTTAAAGSFTTLSSTGVTTLGNNSATVAVNSSDWDITTAGVMTGISGITSDGNYVQSAGTMSLTSANTTQTTTSSIFALNGNSLSSGTGAYLASSSLTSGKLLDIQVSGTAAAASQTGLNILTTGANGTAGITTYGAQISNTHSTNTSTNVGLYVNASGGATANYGLIVDGGSVGIGTTAPIHQLHLNSASSPAYSQFNIQNNLTGALSGLVYTADNVALGFDTDFNNGQFRARDDTVALMRKLTDKFEIYGSGSNTIGNTATLNNYFSLDLASGFIGINDGTPDARLDIDSSSTTGGDFLLTNTGAGTSGSIFGITADAVTSGDIMTISAAGMTSGTALTLTGPSTTGVTDHFVKITSDVGGSSVALVNLSADFTGAGGINNFSLRNVQTDSTANANNDFGYIGQLTLTGNAAKVGHGIWQQVTTSSTTADNIRSATFNTLATGAISSGTRNNNGIVVLPVSTAVNTTGGIETLIGVNSAPSSTGTTTGTVGVYGVYTSTTGTLAGAGVMNQYGVYIANGTSSTTGTSVKTGLYVESPTGADTNYAAIFAGGNVGIGTTAPNASLHVNGTTQFDGNVWMTSGINALGDQGSMVPNTGFEIYTGSAGVADGWASATSGTAAVAITTTSPAQGTNSQTLQSNTGGGNAANITSLCFPITGGRSYNVYDRIKANTATTQGHTLRLLTYTTQANCTADTSATNSDAVSNAAVTTSYADAGSTVTPASTQLWARLRIFNANPNVTATFTVDGVRVTPSALTVGVDLAENFPVDSNNVPKPGEIVTMGDMASIGIASVKPADQEADKKTIGVVSTQPGLTLNDGQEYTKVPVALSGRVPVIVSTAGGSIDAGDFITSSTLSGVGKKLQFSGQTIGKALSSTSNWTTQSCTAVNSLADITWPADDGTNSAKPCFSLPDGTLVGKLMVFLNLGYQSNQLSLSDEGEITLTGTSSATYAVATPTGSVNTLGAFASATIAKLQVGLAQIKEIFADRATITHLQTDDISPISSGSAVTVHGELAADTLRATTASISGQLQTNTLLADLIQTNTVTANTANLTTATVSALTTDTIIGGSARLNYLESKVAQLETARIDSFTAMTATISGTLYANNIADFDQKVADTFRQPSLLATILNQTPGSIPDQPLASSSGTVASSAAQLRQTLADLDPTDEDIVINPTAVFIKRYFEVSGNSYLAGNVGVGGSLVIGDGLRLSGNELAYTPTQGDPAVFKIQPSGVGKLELMGGQLTLSDTGLVEINGDLKVAGAFTTDGDVTTKGDIELVGPAGATAATISSAGAINTTGAITTSSSISGTLASFANLKLASEQLTATGSGTVDTTKPTGRAKLSANQTEITLKSELVTSQTLIYITPLGSTNNQVLYVKSQTAEDANTSAKEGEFKIGVDQPLAQDIEFTWWLIN